MGQHLLFRLCIFLIGTGTLTAQQLTPVVVSTSGGFFQSSAGMLSYTVGEMASIETYISASSILTQGFQQDWEVVTGISENPGYALSFYIFPNPSDGRFQLVTEADAYFNAEIKITDMLGRQLFTDTFDHNGGLQHRVFDIIQVPSGVYTIELITKARSGQPQGLFTQRMQIIR